MGKYNTAGLRPAASSPITTTGPALTHEGGPGFERDAKGELFLLAAASLTDEKSFYEPKGDRADRFRKLVHMVALDDGAWMLDFVTWLRGDGNIRSAALVAALEAIRARVTAGIREGNRQLIDAAIQRGDEPGEAIAYWQSRYGRSMPIPVKRGISDAIRRVYTERSLIKWDSRDNKVRFADVLELVHARPTPRPDLLDRLPAEQLAAMSEDDVLAYIAEETAHRAALFSHAIDRRQNPHEPISERLGMLRARAEFLAVPHKKRRKLLLKADGSQRLAAAGITWEALAGWLEGPMDAAAWEAVIPSMGVMALARNLRNFDQVGVSDEVAEQVCAKFADPDVIASSRMFPFRWWQAYQAAPSLRWGHALDKALSFSTQHIPSLPGRTLVLVDTSSSMEYRVSERSEMNYVQAAALFGVALTMRGASVDLHGFADGVFRHEVRRGGSVLSEVDRFVRRVGEVGHGTQIASAVRSTYRGHDRIVIFSDMQTFNGGFAGNASDAAPAHVPMYGFNLVGYRYGAIPSGTGTRHELGGLTDATFRALPLLEAGRNASWPWETLATA
ncbi:TROVE domain-containing protein [Actinocorallia herbida]|uniref:TROVE domain-containing protein n=1 Tax=Actinocorallia herbida TaxID=58109 RepID=A0A3N1CMR6_9ACTN|nr:TROVE domain-containing protein [Actinocorallia herbida]ROO82609.1 TROVE domain-containing protein [Actinocorallia herbida]